MPPNGNLSVGRCSPAIDKGIDLDIQRDATDVSDVGAAYTAQIPWDHKTTDRRILMDAPPPNDPGIVDLGAFEECFADVNGNGEVDLPDLSILVGCFGGQATCVGTVNPLCCCCWADLDCNGLVQLPDLSLLLTNFGLSCRTPEGGGGGFAPPGGGDGGAGDDCSGGIGDQIPGAGAPPSDDPFIQWLRSATVSEIFDWYNVGMPR